MALTFLTHFISAIGGVIQDVQNQSITLFRQLSQNRKTDFGCFALCSVLTRVVPTQEREKNGVQFSNIRYQTVFCFWAGVIDEI